MVFSSHLRYCQPSVTIARCWLYWAPDFIYGTWPSPPQTGTTVTRTSQTVTINHYCRHTEITYKKWYSAAAVFLVLLILLATNLHLFTFLYIICVVHILEFSLNWKSFYDGTRKTVRYERCNYIRVCVNLQLRYILGYRSYTVKPRLLATVGPSSDCGERRGGELMGKQQAAKHPTDKSCYCSDSISINILKLHCHNES